MKQIIGQKGSNSLGSEVIEAFCSGAFGHLPLDNAEDYNNILYLFCCFVAGTAWALRITPLMV